ncbi:signal transduction histidine kinase [Clostridium acetobutylicum]|uniref:histidine kinase n=1 Tax=Clostridium acetobutylicum (strain ATCC 824 / DSM 792 / JCM 1419 / IAM 19013 / LMG 5710 / NBRC 13948 / NRRL B-527 / VKM B-1787 / 2291 / W) TaxID=272562 RepID=Q97F15_CLOAB|nr:MULTISPECIES: sensor histidine kinase [Clostridium]AAK80882.1 Membrane-associated sensory histidine kinase-like ATPase [Clostridium acetobutylicum ATCC 824]ADZ21984.1 Membrane-associated sensory histidine kinase-like ATPase [Clostridium acetobutylicum EA 2018]AEI34196.1 membrane-associated sensory histidine kinase-like ATPase [Clostridium acetobutylicum DSM 1731]AWV78706.1 sensor histidine kinase [Clostridium acetobutylicum]MBC2393569.1 sensor histidine kinase [Clostridium acetobutylicum]
MKNKSYYFLTIIRYAVYLLIGMCAVFYGELKNTEMYYFIVFFLMYIIVTQFRIYYLRNRKYVSVSMVVDLVLVCFMYSYVRNFSFLFLFISVLDSSIMLSKTQAYASGIICSVVIIIQNVKIPFSLKAGTNLINILFSILLIFTLVFIGDSFREEQKRKIEAQGLYDRLRESEEKLRGAYEKLERYSETVEELSILRERNRISREIHDSVGHTLSAVLMQLQALLYLIKSDKEESLKTVEEMTGFVRGGIENVRRTVRELKPTDFDRFEGVFAIEEMIRKYKKLTSADIRFILSKEKRSLSSDESFISYRVVQEALNNAIRHGKASLVEVSMQFNQDRLYIRIKDNGVGTDGIKKGFGMTGMEERVKKLGGNIEFYSERDKGFEVTVNLPKSSEEKNSIINY